MGLLALVTLPFVERRVPNPVMVLVPLTLALIAPVSGRLSDRIGSRWLAAGGLAIACLGLILMSQINEHSSIFDLVWRMILTSIGQGLFQAPNNSALLGAAPRDLQGSASGFLA
ncbi:MAG TPA: MFS transporter, partial [Ktedonobacteraceae bacterium]|nr:MFS transporter [Ktedonobacteraceae bacterium]